MRDYDPRQRHRLSVGNWTQFSSKLQIPVADRERLRWLRDQLNRNRNCDSSAQTLPDGGLIRSTRLARLEAALLVADAAVASRKLAQTTRLIDASEVHQLVQILNESYDRTHSAFRIEQTAAGYLMMTRASLSPWLDRIHNRQAQMRLSAAVMETLTIIAYQQPVTRADVEAIRGVQSAEMIRLLMDRGLVRIAGEDSSLGRPFLYVTTRSFLSMFGLRRLEDLPNATTLRRIPTAVSDNQNENTHNESGVEEAA